MIHRREVGLGLGLALGSCGFFAVIFGIGVVYHDASPSRLCYTRDRHYLSRFYRFWRFIHTTRDRRASSSPLASLSRFWGVASCL